MRKVKTNSHTTDFRMKNKELKTGLFVLTITVAVILGINYLRGNGLFSKGYTFISTYDNVEGLNPATPVYIHGFKAGSIMSIRYNGQKHLFDIKMNVSGDFDIPSDSRTQIYSSDILGGKSIRILPGTSTEMAESGDTLTGSVQADMLSSLMESLAPLGGRVDTLVQDLDRAVKKLDMVLCEENISHVSALLTSIRRSAAHLENIMSAVGDKSPELGGIITDIKRLTESLNASSVRLDSTLTHAEGITAQLEEAELKETVASLRSLLEKLQDSGTSIGKIMTTDSLHNSLERLVEDLDSLVYKIKENPRKNLKISVF